MINSAIAILVLGLFAFYHAYLIREGKLLSDQGMPATLRRLFVYFFTAFGLSQFVTGLIQLLRWLFTEFSTSRIDPALVGLTDASARLIIGFAVWLLFWRAAQKLFYSGIEEERDSALRKFYLYLVVFICTITVVSDLAIIGASQLRRLLGLKPAEDTGIVMSSLIVGAIIWPRTTCQLPIKHNVPCRVYSNSIRAGWPGFIGIVLALRSNAWMPVISSTLTVCVLYWK
jgi:hypothetical protein